MSGHELQDNDLISRSTTVVAADTSDETILIDIDSGYFFQLNKTAARIWNLVEQPRPFADLCAALQAGFRDLPDNFGAEVARFVADMRDRGLITVTAG